MVSYSVAEMADLIFGEASAPSCYATHRLLSEDRTFFKQVSRAPPLFQARSAKEVSDAHARLEALQAVSALPHAVTFGLLFFSFLCPHLMPEENVTMQRARTRQQPL